MSALYPGACCDSCGRNDTIGKPRNCDGGSCGAVNQDSNASNAARALGGCDNGYCGLPANMDLRYDAKGPSDILFGGLGQCGGSSIATLGGRPVLGSQPLLSNAQPGVVAVPALVMQPASSMLKPTGTMYAAPAPTRNAGETDAAWIARWNASHWDQSQPTELPTEYSQRMSAYRIAGGLGIAQPPVTTTADANAWSPTQIAGLTSGVIAAAASTILALVAGARAADAQARLDAANAESQRIAQAASDADRVQAAVTAAANALSKAQIARILAATDRATATTRLSEAQGALAAAQGARGAFQVTGTHVVPPVLESAVRDAAAEISAVRDLIANSTLPLPLPTSVNPYAAYEAPPVQTMSLFNLSTWSTGQKVAGGVVLVGGAYAVAKYFGGR